MSTEKAMSMTLELNADTITKVMSMEGPTVKAVLLKEDGSVEEIDLDTTPKLNATAKVLGGNPTFVGQWPELNVVIMCVYYTAATLNVNKHKLQAPFSKKYIKGDILLLRMDEESTPVNFTKEEWERFQSETIAEAMEEENEDEAPIQIPIEEAPQATDDQPMEEDEEADEDFEAEEEEDDDEDDEEEDEEDRDDEEREKAISSGSEKVKTFSSTRASRSAAAKAAEERE